MDGYVTTQDAAKELGVSARRIQALITAGRLPAQRVGSGQRAIYLIARSDLDAVRDRKAGRPPKEKAIAAVPPKKRGGNPKDKKKGKTNGN